MGKNVSSKCNEKLLDHTKQSATDAPKTTSKTGIEKTAEATENLICMKMLTKLQRSQKYHQR